MPDTLTPQHALAAVAEVTGLDAGTFRPRGRHSSRSDAAIRARRLYVGLCVEHIHRDGLWRDLGYSAAEPYTAQVLAHFREKNDSRSYADDFRRATERLLFPPGDVPGRTPARVAPRPTRGVVTPAIRSAIAEMTSAELSRLIGAMPYGLLTSEEQAVWCVMVEERRGRRTKHEARPLAA